MQFIVILNETQKTTQELKKKIKKLSLHFLLYTRECIKYSYNYI